MLGFFKITFLKYENFENEIKPIFAFCDVQSSMIEKLSDDKLKKLLSIGIDVQSPNKISEYYSYAKDFIDEEEHEKYEKMISIMTVEDVNKIIRNYLGYDPREEFVEAYKNIGEAYEALEEAYKHDSDGFERFESEKTNNALKMIL